ncbi:PAS domain S-box protein [Arsenicibacter rosenii]|uniref:histidine kinase n=1 Tax=Arsenicibacter rosenii TaxID=1750698 RepID=A0A1S2VNH6_9BACT|nr:PAS domain S-box protein [Arsenicibacter rosenii]OIN59726.1 hypothetical protein BLX24_07640 [Arsenicibacter rosenii]
MHTTGAQRFLDDLTIANERFDLLTRASHDVIWDWDLEQDVIFWNEAYQTMLGYTDYESAKPIDSWSDYIHPDDKKQVVAKLKKAISRGDTQWNDEYRFRKADGTYAYIQDRGYVIRRGGKPVRMVGAMQDITDHLRLQQDRDNSVFRANMAIEASGMGVWSVYALEDRMELDDRCQAIYHWPGRSPKLTEMLAWIHPDDQAPIYDAMARTPRSSLNKPAVIEFRLTSPIDRKTRWIRLIGRAYFNETGQAHYFTGMAADITEEKRKEEALKQVEERFQSAFDHADVGVVISDPKGKFLLVNKGYCQMTGYSPEALYEGSYADLNHPEDAPRKNALFKEKMEQKASSFTIDSRYVRKDGRQIWVNHHVTLIYTAAGDLDSIFSILRDITEEKKQSEEQQKLLFLVENSSDFIVLSDWNGRVTYLNAAGQRMVGLDNMEEAKRQNIDYLMPEEIDRVIPQIAPSLLEHNRWSGEVLYRHFKTGEAIPVHGTMLLITDPVTKKPIGRASVVRDLRPEKAAQKSILESERRFREMITQAPVAIGLLRGEQFVVESANEKLLAMWQQSDSLIGKKLTETLPADQYQYLFTILDKAYQSGEVVQVEEQKLEQIQDGKPQPRYVNVTYKPLQDDRGGVYAVLIMAIDITGRVRARQKRAEAEEVLRGAIELAGLGTWWMDARTNTLYFSDRMVDWYGLPGNQASLDLIEQAVDVSDRERLVKAAMRAFRLGLNGKYEEEYTIRNLVTGRKRIISAQGKVTLNAEGEPVLLRGTAQDITARKMTEQELERQVDLRTQELRKLNASLLQTNQELERFAYIASHDLQEPLRKVQAFGSILEEEYGSLLDTHGLQMLNRMQASANRMSLLIKDILEFSRTSQLQGGATYEQIDLAQVIGDVQKDLELLITQKQAVIEVGELEPVEGVSLQMYQLFYNLIGNALKFSKPAEAPHIRIQMIRLSLAGQAGYPMIYQGNEHCRISVTDNGIGFNPLYAQQIFGLFQRLHGKQQYEGTGIGLALCQRIVMNHQGEIRAESVEGEGATFHIVLPYKQPGTR